MDTVSEKAEIVVDNDQVVRKSNYLIMGKFAASAYEDKIFALATSRLQLNEKDGTLSATLYTPELKDLFGVSSDSHFYTKLRETASVMPGHVIGIEDEHGKDFSFFSMVTNAEYMNGKFTVTFNKMMTPHLYDLKSNYTSYLISNIKGLKYSYSYRIFEILQREEYKLKTVDVVKKDYDLNELKFMIGVLSFDQDDKLRKMKQQGATWSQMAEKAKYKRFERWDSFQSRVLKKAQKELAECTDICFDYEVVKVGRGARVCRIIFYVRKNDGVHGHGRMEKIVRSEPVFPGQTSFDQEPYALPAKIAMLVGHKGLTEKNLEAIYTEAGADQEKVIRAVEYADGKTGIDNYVGYIRSLVREGGMEAPVPADVRIEDAKVRVYRDVAQSAKRESAESESRLNRSMWQRAKQKEEFADFQKALEAAGFGMEAFEDLLSSKEKVNMYYDWKRTGRINEEGLV